MNLWDRKLGLFLIAALTFFACEEELSTINLAPENNLGIFFVETSLADNVNQVWAGSSPSSFSGLALVGSYQDPEFGKIKSRAFCDITIGNANYSKSTINSAESDDLTFTLRISSASGTYTALDEQVLELYKLTETVGTGTTSASSIPLGEKIGEAKFQLYPDSINLAFVDGQDETKYDGNRVYNYYTTFTLSDEYQQEFFDAFKNAVIKGVADPDDSDDLDSVSYYLDEYLKGIAIIGGENNSAIISYILPLDEKSQFTLNYTIENVPGTRTNTSAVFLLNSPRSFNNIEPNELSPWDNSSFDDINEINSIFKTADDQAYFQSGTNMFINLNFADFINFKDTLSNPIIQKAELVIENLINPQSRIITPASIGVFLTSIDSINNGSLSNSLENIELPSQISYSETNNRYTIQVTLYTQALADKRSAYDQLIIGLNPLARDLRVDRFVVKKEDIKIRYYYSVPDKN